MPTTRITSKQVSPATTFRLDADVVQTDVANRRWLVRFYLRANNGPGGSTSSRELGYGYQQGIYNGKQFGIIAGEPFMPAGLADNAQRWNRSYDVWISANSNGYWSGSSTTLPLAMRLNYGSVDTTPAGSLTLPRIGGVPSTPVKPVLKTVLAQSAAYTIFAPSNNGSPITTYNHQVARDAAFTTGIIAWNSGASNQTVSGLRPGTPYWARYRAVNAFGVSGWSQALAFTTIATEAPGQSVVPSLDGTTATVNATPPSGFSGVTSYIIERRVDGGAATVIPTVTPSTLVEGLTPGLSYQWRVSAMIDGYQTPWSTWVTVAQPKPSTSPGDYFDGATPAKTDTRYAWVGTANNSMSRTLGTGVLGWKVDVGTSGGLAVLHRSTGGQTQQFAARALITTSATAAGIRVGTQEGNLLAADVSEGGLYRIRIAARPSRAQRLVAEVSWYDIGMVKIGSQIVTDEVLAGTTSWTLFTGTATAPAGTMYATVAVLDVVGTGHSVWLSGQYIDVDSAFITLGGDLIDYFDGSTPDTAQFSFEWVGLANRSPSLRREIFQDAINPLADPDCDPIPGAPRPPVIENSCIEETGSWRRYWAIIPESEVFDWLTVVPTITVSTATTPARQVRLRFYENPENVAPVDADGLPYQSEQIISYMPKNSSVTIDAVSETAWAIVAGFDGEIPAEELLYGTGGGPATWPVLACGSSYLISFDVPLDAPVGNITYDVSLTTRMS